MSEPSSLINCGSCGDPIQFGDPHTNCWVRAKISSQEDLKEQCPICFEDIVTPHWRCHDDGIKNDSGIWYVTGV